MTKNVYHVTPGSKSGRRMTGSKGAMLYTPPPSLEVQEWNRAVEQKKQAKLDARAEKRRKV